VETREKGRHVFEGNVFIVSSVKRKGEKRTVRCIRGKGERRRSGHLLRRVGNPLNYWKGEPRETPT